MVSQQYDIHTLLDNPMNETNTQKEEIVPKISFAMNKKQSSLLKTSESGKKKKGGFKVGFQIEG